MEGGLYRPIAQLLRGNRRNDAINAAAWENGDLPQHCGLFGP
jgi:hypothetical protein